MVARLGRVLYWLGSGVAIALVALGVVTTFIQPPGQWYAGLVFYSVLAILCWLFGRACKYVLAGE
jgi:hypothetical protein